jgi:hypothetical protein
MMKKALIPVLFLIVPCINALPQEISHQVLVPLAGLAKKGVISYSQTVGETAVEIVGCYNYVLTQGFQQPLIKLKIEQKPNGTGVLVYPNPVTDYVTIEIYGDRAKTIRIDIISITGITILSDTKIFNDNFWYKDRYNVEGLSRGLYLIRITANDGMLNRVFKIEKL